MTDDPGGEMTSAGEETNWLPIVALVSLAALAGALFVYVRITSELTPPAPASPTIIVTEEEHRVTPEMQRASDERSGNPAPRIVEQATDGRMHDLVAEAEAAPLFLVFIKDGCPCSESAQPYYNRLHAAYGRKATFLGVIDRDVAGADAWGKKHRAMFPILADPGLETVRAFGVTNSAYAAIVHKGTIARLWPGYSKGMLVEASDQLARFTGVDPRSIDTSDAPTEPYSGCPYDLDPSEPPATAPDSPSELPPSVFQSAE